jgi:ankyrin repeat protein
VGGGDFNSQGGWTALILAAWNGHADCVRLLIDAGAGKDARNNVRHSR